MYPGQTVTIPIRSVDEAGNTVWSQALRVSQDGNANPDILESQTLQVTHESSKNECSIISITLFAYEHFHHQKVQVFTLSIPPFFDAIQLNLFNCPPGFTLSTSKGVCQCGKAIEKLYKTSQFPGDCDFENLTVSKPFLSTSWMGTRNVSGCNSKLSLLITAF